VDILFIEMHICSRGIRALFSIEYIKIIVEKIRRTVIKKLRIKLILAVNYDTPRAFSTIKKPSPYTVIISGCI